MWIRDNDIFSKSGKSEFDFGLFGRWSHRHVNAIEDKTKIINGPGRYSDIKLVDMLAWDGQKHRFEVNTSEYAHLVGDYDQFEGVLDFTGISAAYSKLQECHAAKSQ